MNIHVIKIGEILKNSLTPLTNKQIADEMGVSRQTIFNHMPEAIRAGLAMDTGMREGKAVIYSAPNYKASKHYIVPWQNDKPAILKDILTEWCAKQPPVAAIPLFRHITSLYEKTLTYLNDDTDERPTSEKVMELKELRAQIKRTITTYETLLRVARALYSDENLFHPRDIVTALIIKDDDTTPHEIRAILDRRNK